MMAMEEILGSVDKLPPLSPTIAKVVEVANNPQSSPNEMSNVIKMDPVLTAKVLKLVNSAYFSLPDQVTSLNRAIILLGLNTIKNLALSTAVIGQFSKPKSTRLDMKKFWEHSMATAVGAKKLAQLMKVDRRFIEEYFIAGLLHKLGVIVLVELYPDRMDALFDRIAAGMSLSHAEQEILGVCHEDVGAAIGKHWHMTENLISVMKEYNDPDLTGEFAKLVLPIHVASRCSAINGYAIPGAPVEPPADEILAHLALTRDQVNGIFANLKDDMEKASAFLKTASGA